MIGGTLVVSRAYNLFSHIKKKLLDFGFIDVEMTKEERDSLNMLINKIKPGLVIFDADFFYYTAPYMLGQLLLKFPKLNIAVVAMWHYPVNLAMRCILNGVKSYAALWDGIEEFRLGLSKIRDGKSYVSPAVTEHMTNCRDCSSPKKNITEREKEVLRLVCSGLSGDEIGQVMQISRRTVEDHKKSLRKVLNVRNERELIWIASHLELVDEKEVHFFTA